MKKHHLSKIAVAFVAIAAISLIAGILTRRHAPPGEFEFGKNFPRLEHDARPERPPEIVGKIESVVGNEITIAKLEQPENDFKTRRTEIDNLSAAERITQMEARLNAFTGENIVVEIPAGIEITRRMSPPKNVESMREFTDRADFIAAADNATILPTELAENDFVAIWLNPDFSEQNVAEFLNLIFTENNDYSQ